MKLKIFKSIPVTLTVVLITIVNCFAQADSAVVSPPVPPAPVNVVVVSPQPMISAKINTKALKVQLHQLTAQLKSLSVTANTQVMAAVNNLNVDINAVAPQIAMSFKESNDNSSSNIEQDQDQLVKNYSKTYPVDANDALAIDNRYGKVTVNTWSRNEIKVDVQIKVDGSDGQKTLDNVTISDDKSGSLISFKTNIGEVKSSWMSMLGGRHSGSSKMEINYTVYMPAKNDLTIDNRYGAVEIGNMEGRVTINCAYGSFSAKSMASESSVIVKYGNAEIGNLGSSALEVSYGSLTIGTADKVMANVSYSGINIDKIKTSGNINLRYGGGLKIGDVDKNMKSLSINSSYSNVDIGLSGDENTDFSVTVHYGDFNYGDHDVTVTDKTPDDDRKVHFTKNYKGHVGKGNSEKSIEVYSNYGNVKFD
jgi:hypothetical protein